MTRSGVVLAVLLGGQFMAVLDASIVNIAIPSIKSSLHASGSALQLIVGGYVIAYAVLLATLAFSLISAVLAPRPRLTHHPAAERSFFYFGDIYGMETADYVRAFMGLSVEAALDQVLTQVHVNAKIVHKKYLWTRRAVTGFVAATVVWLAVQLAFWLP